MCVARPPRAVTSTRAQLHQATEHPSTMLLVLTAHHRCAPPILRLYLLTTVPPPPPPLPPLSSTSAAAPVRIDTSAHCPSWFSSHHSHRFSWKLDGWGCRVEICETSRVLADGRRFSLVPRAMRGPLLPKGGFDLRTGTLGLISGLKGANCERTEQLIRHANCTSLSV